MFHRDVSHMVAEAPHTHMYCTGQPRTDSSGRPHPLIDIGTRGPSHVIERMIGPVRVVNGAEVWDVVHVVVSADA